MKSLILPDGFESFSLGWLPQEAIVSFKASLEEEAPVVSLRFNEEKSFKSAPEELVSLFGEEQCKGAVKWAANGFYLKQRPLFAADPLYHAGLYYVQDASSMFMDLAFKIIEYNLGGAPLRERRLRLLDLCASPGGKSTHLLSLVGKESLLVSNEAVSGRTASLAENIARWGSDNVVVTNNDAADFKRLKSFFDIIVVDAPCSGEGMFRKSGAAVGGWSRESVMLCAGRQRRILNDIWEALAPGGFLVYSTCTYNSYENDGNIDYLLERGAELLSPSEGELAFIRDCGIVPTPAGGFQFLPGMVEGEGQYFAVVRKEEGERFHLKRSGKKEKSGRGVLPDGFTHLFPEYDIVLCDTLVKGFRSSLHSEMEFVAGNLKCISSGLLIGQMKGSDFIPHADFALSLLLAEGLKSGRAAQYGECFKSVEVEKAVALSFLAREPFPLDNAPCGYLLLLYRGRAIGFVKNLGKRVNNLHPVARRIRRSDIIAR